MVAHGAVDMPDEFRKVNSQALAELKEHIEVYCVNASVNRAWPLRPYRCQDEIFGKHWVMEVDDGRLVRNMVNIQLKVTPRGDSEVGFIISKAFIVEVDVTLNKRTGQHKGKIIYIEEIGLDPARLILDKIKFSRGGRTTQGDIVKRLCGLRQCTGRRE